MAMAEQFVVRGSEFAIEAIALNQRLMLISELY